METINKIAEMYADFVFQSLDINEMSEIISGKSVANDFYDANEDISDAFIKVVGRDWVDCDADLGMMNAALDMLPAKLATRIKINTSGEKQ